MPDTRKLYFSTLVFVRLSETGRTHRAVRLSSSIGNSVELFTFVLIRYTPLRARHLPSAGEGMMTVTPGESIVVFRRTIYFETTWKLITLQSAQRHYLVLIITSSTVSFVSSML